MELLFITNEKVYGDISSNNKVILSPSFYWIKKKKLKLLFEFQATDYANSVFEGFLPDGEFQYIVKKSDDEFLFLAYDKAAILEKLKKLGLETSNISSLYFSQFELKESLPLNVDNSSLVIIDDVVQIISQKLAQNDIYLMLPSLKLSSTNIHINSSVKFSFTPFLVFLFVLFVVEYIAVTMDVSSIENKKNEIKKEYKLPTTSYELNSILSKYEKQDNEQKFIREALEKIKYKKDCFDIKVDTKKMLAKCRTKDVEVNNR